MITVLGIDLAGSEKRNTGVCLLHNDEADACIMHTDDEIIDFALKFQPKVIAIDAPLSIPKDRETIEDRSGSHLRECDRELQRRKIKFFPITLGPMRMLTTRGLRLKEKLSRFSVIEVYPGAAQDIWGIPRKQRGLVPLRDGLLSLGLKKMKANLDGDELDAVACALVGRCYLENDFVEIGHKSEGTIILPP